MGPGFFSPLHNQEIFLDRKAYNLVKEIINILEFLFVWQAKTLWLILDFRLEISRSYWAF